MERLKVPTQSGDDARLAEQQVRLPTIRQVCAPERVAKSVFPYVMLVLGQVRRRVFFPLRSGFELPPAPSPRPGE